MADMGVGGGGGGVAPTADMGVGGGDAPMADMGIGGGDAPMADSGVDSGIVDPTFMCGDVEGLVYNAAAESMGDGTWQYVGETAGEMSGFAGTCGGDAAVDGVFEFTAPEAGTWFFTTTPTEEGFESFDTVMYVRTTCDDEAPESELGCNDDSGGLQSRVEVDLEAEETVYIFVDGYSAEAVGPYMLTVGQSVILDIDAPCVAGNLDARCIDGSACLDPDGDETFNCTEVAAPTLDEAELFFNTEYQSFAVRLSGQDADGDVIGFGLLLFDAEGEEIPLSFFGGPVDVGLSDIEVDGAAFTAEASFMLGIDGIAGGEFTVFDQVGLRSEPIAVDAIDPVAAASGDTCDLNRALNACVAGTYCDAAGADADFLCAAPVAECDAGVEVIDLNANAADSGWSYSGDSTGAPILGSGSCGGGGGEHVFSFTAQAGGDFVFETALDGAGVDTAMFAREFCGVEDIAAEIDCGDDIDSENVGSRIQVSLEAGQTTWIYVASFMDDDVPTTGPYTLTGKQISPPTMTTLEAWFNADSIAIGLHIEGTDPDNDVMGIGLQLLDADGAVIFPEGDEPLELALGESALEQADGSYTINFSGLLPDDTNVDAIDTYRVDVFDAEGLRSPAQNIQPMAPPAVARGAECDVVGARSRCADGDLCFDADTEDEVEPVCVEAVAECPAEWGAPVALVADGDIWTATGDTTDVEGRTGGTCGGGTAPELVYTFTAPQAGPYTINADKVPESGIDPVLYVRTHCRFAAPTTELACNDDTNGTNSQVVVELDANQMVYVFADAWRETAGPVVITVRAGEPVDPEPDPDPGQP